VAILVRFLEEDTQEIDIMVEAKAKENAIEAIKAYM
jgi:UV DNA damage repair endonuclease